MRPGEYTHVSVSDCEDKVSSCGICMCRDGSGGWDVDIRNRKSPLNDTVNRRNSDDRVMVNNELERRGRKRSWPDCHSILLERLRNAKNLSWWCMSWSGFEPNQQQSFLLNKLRAAVLWCCTFKDFLIFTKVLLSAGCLVVVFSTNVILSLTTKLCVCVCITYRYMCDHGLP